MNEPEIVQGCRRRDREAQHALYALTSERVYRALLRISGNADDAMELAQEAYIRVFERIDQFQGTSGIATWVYRIAVNEALQFLRRKKRALRLAREELEPGAEESARLDARIDVKEALGRVPDDERLLLVLRYFEGLDYAEMARVLEKPPGTIASGLNRARGLLRDLLGGNPGKPAGIGEETGRAEHRKD